MVKENNNITKEERGILFHTLGLSYQKTPFRNHFVAGPNHDDLPLINSLIKKGLMKLSKSPSFLDKGDSVYIVTTEGKMLALELKKELEPKLTRSQKRYRLYLECSDITNENFIEWLKNPLWNRSRKDYGC